MTIKRDILLAMPIGNVLRRWPETVRCLLAFGMLCVGCPVAAFHSVADACREHDLDAEQVADCLTEAIASRRRTGASRP